MKNIKISQIMLLVCAIFCMSFANDTTRDNFSDENFAEMKRVCNATVSNLQANRNGDYITFSFNTSGAAAYTYGGYYNTPSGIVPFSTTTVYTSASSHDVVLYSPQQSPPNYYVVHFGVTAKCSNGESGGQDDIWTY